MKPILQKESEMLKKSNFLFIKKGISKCYGEKNAGFRGFVFSWLKEVYLTVFLLCVLMLLSWTLSFSLYLFRYELEVIRTDLAYGSLGFHETDFWGIFKEFNPS